MWTRDNSFGHVPIVFEFDLANVQSRVYTKLSFNTCLNFKPCISFTSIKFQLELHIEMDTKEEGTLVEVLTPWKGHYYRVLDTRYGA